MISCTEFIPANSELFKFLEEKGGKQAAKTTRERYGKDFYHRIGKLGGNPVLLAMRKAKEGEGTS